MQTDSLPPNSAEAERGVLGCCLLDSKKAALAIKAGVNSRWFFDNRHSEVFNVLSAMTTNGGGDALVTTLMLRERGKLESIGGLAYLNELQNAVPSPENIDYYIPELRDYFWRRQVLSVADRLKMLAEDPLANPASLLADTGNVIETLQRQVDLTALPDIILATEFLATDMTTPPEVIGGVLHQGSKLIVGGSSKSYKTWTLTDLAVSVATGTPWLGFPTTSSKVLYINLEIQPAFFRRRIAEVVAAKQVVLNGQLEIWNLRGCSADYRALVPKIRTRIRDQGHSLVIIDPTYKLLGTADENSATDITALLGMVESVAVSTGAAVALAGHFAKGNPSAKETIDRISGSGVFARDPDSLVIFTKHEEEGAFAVELVLRNLAPVEPFVVQWHFPLFVREESLDPSHLKQVGGRPAKHKPEALLQCLGDLRLTTTEWKDIAEKEHGVSKTRFFELIKGLEEEGKIGKSVLDSRWHQIRENSRNLYPYNDQ